MNLQQFNALAAAGFNRIPVHRSVLVDSETPVSSYHKLARGAYSFLLESVQGGEKWGRYSIIGLPCRTRLQIKQQQVRLFEHEQCLETHEMPDPLDFVAAYQARFKVAEVPGLPRFYGGLVGYFGYDCVRYVEPCLAATVPRDELELDDVVLLLAEEVLVFDNLAGILHLIVVADPQRSDAFAQAQARLDELSQQLQRSSDSLPAIALGDGDTAPAAGEQAFVSSFGEQAFKQAVERVREYILAGDCMQVVLSQRLSVAFQQQAFDLYRILRYLNPSPYMYYLNLGAIEIVGASPEVLVRVVDQQVTVRPIAGTRRRGYDEAEDKALERELLDDPKERAEHLMLIDLGRNDIGRVAETGSVELTEEYAIERYSHVMHIVSNVQGVLKQGLSALDALRSILPAGTLSGAPKVRAMQIIDELEPVKRGVYGGAIGYLAWNGDMDTAIAIRTALITQGQLHIQAGAGIVADSQPELEWKETMNKARALFKALALLERSAQTDTRGA